LKSYKFSYKKYLKTKKVEVDNVSYYIPFILVLINSLIFSSLVAKSMALDMQPIVLYTSLFLVLISIFEFFRTFSYASFNKSTDFKIFKLPIILTLMIIYISLSQYVAVKGFESFGYFKIDNFWVSLIGTLFISTLIMLFFERIGFKPLRITHSMTGSRRFSVSFEFINRIVDFFGIDHNKTCFTGRSLDSVGFLFIKC
jgi:hypothetical protein